MHVKFDAAGRPAWFGPKPIEGSAELSEKDRAALRAICPPQTTDADFEATLLPHLLAACLRKPDGSWGLRPPAAPPTPEEIAVTQAELARQLAADQAEAEAARLEQIEQEIVRRAGPDALLRSMGKITIAELNTRVAAIREAVEAAFPAGGA